MDFNGVIIDDEPIQMRAYQEILKDEGIDLTEEAYIASLGMDDRTFVEAAYERAGKTPEPNKVLGITTAKTNRWRELIYSFREKQSDKNGLQCQTCRQTRLQQNELYHYYSRCNHSRCYSTGKQRQDSAYQFRLAASGRKVLHPYLHSARSYHRCKVWWCLQQ